MNPKAKHLFTRLLDSSSGRRAVQIVALGDSVTQGAMEVGRLSPDQTYHRFLQRDLETFYPDTTINITNSGIGGETATQALERFERDALAYSPDLLIIAFGLNDSTLGLEALPSFEAAIRQMISNTRARGPVTLLIATPPFMATERTYRIHAQHENAADIIIATQTSGILNEYAECLRRIAHEEAALLADIHAEWDRLKAAGIDINSWLTNGLNHPDVRGHQIASKVIWNALFAS